METGNHGWRLSSAALLVMVLSSYLWANGAEGSGRDDLSRINGSIEVGARESVGRVSSINGSLRLSAGVQAGELHTVNGGIMVAEDCRIDSAESVNGGIELAGGVQVAGDVRTINGRVRLGPASRIAGGVSTVNGGISLQGAGVEGPLRAKSGDIELLDGSVVEGDIVFEGGRGWWQGLLGQVWEQSPVLRIDASSAVRGRIHLYREVELRIHEDAEVGEIITH